jgi:hypothetical protein
VVIAPSALIGAGDPGAVGTLTINSNLLVQGGATMRVDKTGGTPTQDNVIVANNVTYGGTLFVTNITSDATPLLLGQTFQVFNVAGTKSGNFTSVVGSAGPDLAFSFNPATGVLTVVVSPVTYLQFINPPIVAGTSLTFSATNAGVGTVRLVTSTNLMTPINAWTPIWTNVLGGSSTFTTNLINAVNPAFHQQFYQLIGN